MGSRRKTSRSDRGQRSRLAELLDTLAVREGAHATNVPGVKLARISEGAPRKPILDHPELMGKLKGHTIQRPLFPVAQGWLEPANLRIEEARSLVDQLVGPITSKEAKLEDKIDDIEKQLEAVLDKPRAE